jgi:hypothetical protein
MAGKGRRAAGECGTGKLKSGRPIDHINNSHDIEGGATFMAVALEVDRSGGGENVHDQPTCKLELMLSSSWMTLLNVRVLLSHDINKEIQVITFDSHLNHSLVGLNVDQRALRRSSPPWPTCSVWWLKDTISRAGG